MVDVDAVIRAWLITLPTLTRLVDATRIYADTDLPPGFTLTSPAILFTCRVPVDYTSRVVNPSVQFQTLAPTVALAREVDRALFDTINEKRGTGQRTHIKYVKASEVGQPLPMENGWPRIISFYTFTIGNP